MSADRTSILASLSSVVKGQYEVPPTVVEIAPYAFYNCKGITGLAIPASVRTIGQKAFLNCSAVESLEFAEGVKEIGQAAFSGLSLLTSVSLPSSVEKIGQFVFGDCRHLTTASVPEHITTDPWTFNDQLFDNLDNLVVSVRHPDGTSHVIKGDELIDLNKLYPER
jgi:hypothetical protein